jgi:hypothetical protein
VGTPVLGDLHDPAADHLAVGQRDEDLLARALLPFRLVHAKPACVHGAEPARAYIPQAALPWPCPREGR